MNTIRLVVGVGNPGAQYELTRHNIAWLIFDQFPELQSANWKSKFKGLHSDWSVDGEKRIFLKPQTFMNLSGESVGPLMRFYKIQPQELLVVHDEIDMTFGQISFKDGGGLAGHNGLKSIKQHLGTGEFKRLRVGVSRPSRGDVASWVLAQFKNSEIKDLEKVLIGSMQAIESALRDDFKKVQNKYNKLDFLKG